MAKPVKIEVKLAKAFREACIRGICEALVDDFFENFLPNHPIIIAVGTKRLTGKEADRAFLKDCGIKRYY